VHGTGDVVEVALPLLLEEEREKEDLEEQVAELVAELDRVVGEGCVGDLVGLLDGVRDDRARGLLAVPGAFRPQAPGQLSELDELLAELARAGRPAPETEPDRAVEAELGDLLFTVVNLARFVNVDPELALRGATGRFRGRVERAERLAAEAGETWTELGLEEQERWYERAKATMGGPVEDR